MIMESLWKLKQAVYGTRRAAVLIQEFVIQAMVKIGFTVPSIQAFDHATWLVLANSHGGDFLAAGETQSLNMLGEALEQFFVLEKTKNCTC